MFLEGEFSKQSCGNEAAFNFGVMMAAVWHLTGMVVGGLSQTSSDPQLSSCAPLVAGTHPLAYS